jgi:hypothetical protein
LSRFHKSLIGIGGLTVLLSLAFSWSTSRDLQSVRRELGAVTKANDFLRKTLGDMSVAITAKDREIDRLWHSACEGREKAQPDVPTRLDHNKVSKSAVRAETSRESLRWKAQ